MEKQIPNLKRIPIYRAYPERGSFVMKAIGGDDSEFYIDFNEEGTNELRVFKHPSFRDDKPIYSERMKGPRVAKAFVESKIIV